MYSEQTTYSMQTSKNRAEEEDMDFDFNTGERLQTTDKVCNIYDMASNLMEWSTETYASELYPCETRGGNVAFLSNIYCPRYKVRTFPCGGTARF